MVMSEKKRQNKVHAERIIKSTKGVHISEFFKKRFTNYFIENAKKNLKEDV